MAQKQSYANIVISSSSNNHHSLNVKIISKKKAADRTVWPTIENKHIPHHSQPSSSTFAQQTLLNKPSVTMAEILRRKVSKASSKLSEKKAPTEKTVTINGIRVKITSKRTSHLSKSFEEYEKRRIDNLECSQVTRLLKNYQNSGAGDDKKIYYDLKVVEFTPENQVKGDFGYTCKHRISHCVYTAQFKQACITWPYCSKQVSCNFMNYAVSVPKREVPLLSHGSYLDVRDIDSNCPDDVNVRNVVDPSTGKEFNEAVSIKLSEPSKVIDLLKSHFRPSPCKEWRERASEEGFAFGTVYKIEEITNPKWKNNHFAELIDGMKLISNDEYNVISQCITTIGMKNGVEVPLLFKVDKKHVANIPGRKGSTTIPIGLQNCLSIISQSFGGSVY